MCSEFRASLEQSSCRTHDTEYVWRDDEYVEVTVKMLFEFNSPLRNFNPVEFRDPIPGVIEVASSGKLAYSEILHFLLPVNNQYGQAFAKVLEGGDCTILELEQMLMCTLLQSKMIRKCISRVSGIKGFEVVSLIIIS
jgi:hypothetical protein